MKNSIIIIRKNITNEEMKDVLISCTGFDADYSGENGIDYTSEEALKAGYDSDAEYFADCVLSNYPCDRKAEVVAYLERFFDYNKNYYSDYVVNIKEFDGNIIVSCSCICG